jgi:hypothetical protein
VFLGGSMKGVNLCGIALRSALKKRPLLYTIAAPGPRYRQDFYVSFETAQPLFLNGCQSSQFV